MSGERIVLDPVEVAPNRTELDITAWVRSDGVNWGDAEIEAYRASGVYGDTVIDYRVPNRQVSMPLILKTVGGTAFATIRESIQAKAALFQTEGGWLKRVTASGGTFYADVQVSGLTMSGGWMQAHRDADTEAEIRLECSPDFYGDEVTLPDHTETSAAELVFTETGIDGNYPARVRVVVDEDQGQSQLGLMWGFRSRNYSGAATAALAYEAEALQPLDTAAKAALSGASGGTVVTHGTLSTSWTPVLNLNLGGTAYLTHAGTYRLWCRYRTSSGTAVSLRSVYDVGDLVSPVENNPWYHPAQTSGTSFFIADLGELRLQQGPVGTHRWAGVIQARGAAGGENVSADKVWFQPVDESAGLLRAAPTGNVGVATFTARDGFDQTAGALVAKTAPVGGVWAGGGDTDDFAVETTGKTAQRTAVSDTTSQKGRQDWVPTSMTVCAVQADVKCGTPGGTGYSNRMGVVARVVDTNNWVAAELVWNDPSSGARSFLLVDKNIAGTTTTIGAAEIGLPSFNTYYTVVLVVEATGRFWAGFAPQGQYIGDFLVSGQDAALATGGTLASGFPGIFDANPNSQTATRNISSFAAWVPSVDAVFNASQSAELRTDGMFREDVSGSAYGPVSWVEGDLPRLPVSGLEGRTVQGMVKASRGDFAGLPDTGIDDISARVFYRPCWLTVPGT